MPCGLTPRAIARVNLKRHQVYGRHVASDARQAPAEHAAVVAAMHAGDPAAATAAVSARLEVLRARVDTVGSPCPTG